jgi:hypothetical protein
MFVQHMMDRLVTFNAAWAVLAADEEMSSKVKHKRLQQQFEALVSKLSCGAYCRAVTQMTRVNGHRGDVAKLCNHEVVVDALGIRDQPLVTKTAQQAKP